MQAGNCSMSSKTKFTKLSHTQTVQRMTIDKEGIYRVRENVRKMWMCSDGVWDG